ncbi:MAG: energy transducer TonB [Nitrospinota bacterium]
MTPPETLLGPVAPQDFVRIQQESKKPPEKPRGPTELLSSLDLGTNGPFSPSKPAQPRSRKRARLAPLMTQDVRYRGYRDALWKMIDERLFYPDAAAAEKVRGKVVLRFVVTRDGQLATLELVQSSGFPLFDEEALMAIRRAAPFPKFPPTLTVKRLGIRSEILYEP